mgnify:CR=1 FL=1
MLVLLCLFVSAKSFQHSEIYGSVEELGYYYVEVHVGTPPITQTVIVDTGSTVTAFPCVGCTNCGSHMDIYFDYRNSNTSRVVTCHEGVHCSSCHNDKCGYSQGYAEGSSIAGYLVEDYFGFGNNQEVRFVFGCHTKETNMFRSQKADGIMGLGFTRRNKGTLVDALYENEIVSTDVLGLCLGKTDGFMTVGGFNSSNHLEPIKWVPMHENPFYSLTVSDIKVGGVSLEVDNQDTIIDSGTTFAYLSTSSFNAFSSEFYEYCSDPSSCIGEVQNIASENCFRLNGTLDKFMESFPVISLVVNGTSIEWLPQNYLVNWPEFPNVYCVGVYRNYGRQNVLGAVFMRGQDVVIDRGTERIGFAHSECSLEELHGSSRRLQLQDEKIHKTAYFGLLLSVLILAVGILKLSRSNIRPNSILVN